MEMGRLMCDQTSLVTLGSRDCNQFTERGAALKRGQGR